MKIESLEQVRVPVHAVLGETELSVEELSRMSPGSIVEFDRRAGEKIELRAAGETIAEGEVIVIDEQYGMRITSIRVGESGKL